MKHAPRRLGLDIATHTGWAISEGNKITKGGVRDFSVKTSQHIGRRGIMFYNFLLSLGHFDEIYYEKVQFMGGGKANFKQRDGGELYKGFLMLVNMYSAGFDIPVIGVHPSSLKLQFTGNGHATKEDMCARAHALGWKGGMPGTRMHDDEADAIALIVTQALLRDHVSITC